jgi:proteasome assembly chaperone (PAC2) family protein
MSAVSKSTEPPLREPWLIAAWPGMGNVGIGACEYLVQRLGAIPTCELPGLDLFDVRHVEVRGGLVERQPVPRSIIFQWRDPVGTRDLVIFMGEAQPPVGGYALCRWLLEQAAELGVTRLITFAALATQLHPSHEPRVFGAATTTRALQELRELEVQVLEDGQIRGLNGVLLAAGIEQGIPGVCLLGELPYFAAGIPNPRAAQAVLEIFTTIAGLELDMTEIARASEAIELVLLKLLATMEEALRAQEEGRADEDDEDDEDQDDDLTEEATEPDESDRLDVATLARIEEMFDAAAEDRDEAFRLKKELDRLGVFDEYEDRFLDLFRHAE